MNYDIIYFSGTGGTKLAAFKLQAQLEKSGESCIVYDIGTESFDASKITSHMLIVMYPVHAFGAPIPVYQGLDNLSKVDNIPSVIISISAGGEAPTNNGCRVKAGRKLRRRGYNIIYEDMIMMPSNWAVKDSEEIERMVINALDDKIKIISEILINPNNKQLPSLKNRISVYSRLMAAIGTFSRRVGFPMIGKFYKASDLCNGCSLCAINCPQKNIKMINGKPKFGWKCVVCMRCIYACPMNSISAGPFSFMIVDGGYDMEKLTESAKKYLGTSQNLHDESVMNHKALVKYIDEINDNKNVKNNIDINDGD